MERLLFLFLIFLFNIMPATRAFKVKAKILRIAGVRIHKAARVHSGVHFENKYVSIGDSTWVGNHTRFIGDLKSPIIIGDFCDIGPDCLIIVGSHKIGDSRRRAGQGTTESIIVGDGTWLGARSTVLGGVTIGKGCVIGAGSVVIKNVPDNTLFAGCPAKLIRKLPQSDH